MGTISASGHNGTVEFDGQAVTIKRDGVIAVATKGRGDMKIPISQVVAVEFKPATRLMNGWITFQTAASSAKRRRLGSNLQAAMDDPNSVAIRHKHTDGMQALRDAVQAAIEQPSGGAPSSADEIARLADLHTQGILSDEEFTAAKARILGI